MKPKKIAWKDAAIAASGWTEQEIAQAQAKAVEDAYEKFIAAGKHSLYLQDMNNSYQNKKGSVFKTYEVATLQDFLEAFDDSDEPFTRYINRMGKYWYGSPQVTLFLPV